MNAFLINYGPSGSNLQFKRLCRIETPLAGLLASHVQM